MALSLKQYDGPIQKTRGRATSEESKQLLEALKTSLATGKPFVWEGGAVDAKQRNKNVTKVRNIAHKNEIGLETGSNGTDLQFLAKAEVGNNGPKKATEPAPEPEKTPRKAAAKSTPAVMPAKRAAAKGVTGQQSGSPRKTATAGK
jgi:hypothetical protein